MANIVVVGAQWGDEGKGKVVDRLARESRWVVRANYAVGSSLEEYYYLILAKALETGVFKRLRVCWYPACGRYFIAEDLKMLCCRKACYRYYNDRIIVPEKRRREREQERQKVRMLFSKVGADERWEYVDKIARQTSLPYREVYRIADEKLPVKDRMNCLSPLEKKEDAIRALYRANKEKYERKKAARLANKAGDKDKA